MPEIQPPAPNPCGSCPYRRDVPSGVWEDTEYAKLPAYDRDTPFQPHGVFMCHQQDGRVCAGWVGTHDMAESLAFRLASSYGQIAPDDVRAFLDYEPGVPLFPSGAAAAEHGCREIRAPGPDALRVIAKVERKVN